MRSFLLPALLTLRASVAVAQSNIPFTDTFPDFSKWTFDLGTSYPGGPPNWGTGEVETYTRDSRNIKINSAGNLLITPVKVGNTWTSGRIETKQSFTPQAGRRTRFEARIKLGNAAESKQLGIWPAFWMLGSAFRGNYQNWPAVGELDILESVNGIPKLWQVAHCPTCNEPSGLATITSMSRGSWHTVFVEINRSSSTSNWRTESLTWNLDGRQVGKITGANVGQASWKALAYDPRFLILNVAVGGPFTDAVAGTKTPTSKTTTDGSNTWMEVEYVRVYNV